MPTTATVNNPHTPPYKLAGALTLLVVALATALVYAQFRGYFNAKTPVTMIASRAGLVMYPGAPVTYNGVQIGRVSDIGPTEDGGMPAAKFTLAITPKYMKLLPKDVNAEIVATTLFGNKYVALTTPANPSKERFDPKHNRLHATAVTTENNTMFETLTNLSEKVDPVKLNLTLHALAESLTGLGDRFGQSLVNGNAILEDFNARMPSFRRDVQKFADLADIYYQGAPDLIGFADSASVAATTITQGQRELNATWIKAVPVGHMSQDIVTRMGPDLQRMFADLVPTADLVDVYSPELYCTFRGAAGVGPKALNFLGGGDGYALDTITELVGAANPWIYPDNLPRVNARGGPGGAPGCWQEITHDFWPAPYLVADTGASEAPYNHFEVGSPWAIEYVWGRQVGDETINP